MKLHKSIGISLSVLGVLAGSASAVNYAVLVGVDYGQPGQNWALDATNVRARLVADANWAGANITTISGTVGAGAGQVNKAGILAAIAGVAANAGAGDGFLLYYSGHGAFIAQPGDLERVPPARNPCDEKFWLTGAAAGDITDDELRTAMGAVNANTNKLAFLDCCFAGGWWNGQDAGDLERVAKTTLIAAADENSTAPGSSDITNNWRTWMMGGNAFNLQAMNFAMLNGMFNAIKPGAAVNPQQKNPPGFPSGYNPEYDSFPGAPLHAGTAEIWSNVPAPGAILLALMGSVLTLRRRQR